MQVAKKITTPGSKPEWVWDGANFAWELGPEPQYLAGQEKTNEADRGIVIMIYDKDHLSSAEVILSITQQNTSRPGLWLFFESQNFPAGCRLLGSLFG